MKEIDWQVHARPGYFGKKREELRSFWDQQFGPENWRLAYLWGDEIIPREMALQIYEDGYYEFFRIEPNMLEWLVSTASDVYDTAPSNIQAGLSYNRQETPNNHIHDVAIRRSVLRLGEVFRGDHLVHVRWVGTEGYQINPGVVPFHLPKMIARPKVEGWWFPDTIEDFYQCNKALQVNSAILDPSQIDNC